MVIAYSGNAHVQHATEVKQALAARVLACRAPFCLLSGSYIGEPHVAGKRFYYLGPRGTNVVSVVSSSAKANYPAFAVLVR